MKFHFNRNRAEYIAILALISFIAYMVFSSIYCDYNESIANPSKKTKLLKKQHWKFVYTGYHVQKKMTITLFDLFTKYIRFLTGLCQSRQIASTVAWFEFFEDKLPDRK